jgi:nuclear GTP-binding protein
MGKFSNKAKSKPSKRKTLKQKYKIERKVREFKRKTRKTARKLRATGSKKGGKQEVTLPNLFPFKTEVLDAAKK